MIRALVAGAALSDATRSVQSGCACGRCERSVPSKRLCLVGVVSGEVGPARGGRETVCARVASRLLCGADALCRGVSAVWPLCPLQCAVRHWPVRGGRVPCRALRVCALQALQGSTREGLTIGLTYPRSRVRHVFARAVTVP